MCDEVGLACDIYGPDKIKEMKMGAFEEQVSQGSDEEPRLIVMRYEPERAPKSACLDWLARELRLTAAASPSSPARA